MNTPKHTPGSWRTYNMSKNKILKQWHIQRDDCKHDIALVSLDVAADERESVANLIAAAPVMYQAGKLSLDVMERVATALGRMGNEGLRSIVRSAIIEQKAALKQAEGK